MNDGLTPQDRKALLRMTPEKFAETLRDMPELSRGERRAIQKEFEDEWLDRKKFAGKLTTRADVMWILGKYSEGKLVPLAANLDETARRVRILEEQVAALSLPWWRRLVLEAKDFARRVRRALSRRIVRLDMEEEDGKDVAGGAGGGDTGGAGDDGPGGGAPGDADEEDGAPGMEAVGQPRAEADGEGDDRRGR